VLTSLPFYDQTKVVAVLDELRVMPDADRVVWDPVLMSILSACILQESFKLSAGFRSDEAFDEQRDRKSGLTHEIAGGGSGLKTLR
jgi:hypothetical protein